MFEGKTIKQDGVLMVTWLQGRLHLFNQAFLGEIQKGNFEGIKFVNDCQKQLLFQTIKKNKI